MRHRGLATARHVGFFFLRAYLVLILRYSIYYLFRYVKGEQVWLLEGPEWLHSFFFLPS